MSALLTKMCARCDQAVAVSAFARDKRNRDGLESWCRPCRRKWRAGRKEKEKAYQQKRRAKNPERERERVRRWRAANREKFREQCRRHHANHRDERNAAAALRAREHYAAKPELYRGGSERRRERIKENGGSFTVQEWRALKKKYECRCLCCGKREPEIRLGPDHVVPVSLGGSNAIGNIQPLCFRCNNIKRARVIDYRPNVEER